MHLPLYPLGRDPFLRIEQESDHTSCRRTVAYLSFLPEISSTFSGLWREPEVAYCGDTGLLGVRILPGTTVRKSMNPRTCTVLNGARWHCKSC
jgi:hypothetical protein